MSDQTIVKIGGGALIAVLVTAMLFAMAVAAGGSSRESLDGEWAGGSNSGPQFEAVIDGDDFEVNMVSDGMRSLYWKGDLNLNGEIEDGDVFVSVADQEALYSSLVGSQLEEKEFRYDDGAIVFEFGMLGTTQDVELEEQ